MRHFRVVLPILVLMLVTGAAIAAPPDSRVFQQSPEVRVQEWQQTFLRFIADHPELTIEKVQALEELARIDDRAFFLQFPAKAKRDFLAERMTELGRVLSFSDYRQLVDTAPHRLVNWMKDSEIINEANCNCGDNQDCAGGTCRNVDCHHEGGTTHWGRC